MGNFILNSLPFTIKTKRHAKDVAKANSIIEFSAHDIEILQEDDINKVAFASAKEIKDKQPDLLYVRFKLVHEGVNNNKDAFKKEDLKTAESTPIHKGINWEHGEPVIGVIYASKFVDPSEDGKQSKGKTEGSYIVCEAAIWKIRYPDLAKKIIKRHAEGSLRFSMEVYYSGVECSSCGAYFSAHDFKDGEYCEHLNNRFNVSASDNTIGRYLRGIIFGAAGVVEDPADVQAESLAIAKNREEVVTLDKVKIEMTQEELDSYVKKALAEHSSTTELEAIKKELTDVKASIETLTKEREELKAQLQKVSAEKDTMKTEYDTYKAEIEKKILENKRVSEFKSAGGTMPEKEDEQKAFIETVLSMSDAAFTLYLQSVKPVSASKKDTVGLVPASGSVNKSNASKNKTAVGELEASAVVAAFLAES